jgi:stalled ribosome rescue protein Dom34
MGHTTVWIDHQHTIIFEFTAQGVQEKSLKNEGVDKEHLKQFYHEVAKVIGAPAQLLIVGPGTAKDEFKHHCQDGHHMTLEKAIVGTEIMKSHPRKSEILTVSRKFFDHHFAWHNSDV